MIRARRPALPAEHSPPGWVAKSIDFARLLTLVEDAAHEVAPAGCEPRIDLMANGIAQTPPADDRDGVATVALCVP